MGHLPYSGQRRQVRLFQSCFRISLTTTSLRCIQVIAGVLGRAGEAGQKQRLEAAARGHITYRPAQGLTVDGKGEGDKETVQEKSDAEVAARPAETVSEAELDADAEFSRHMDEVRDGEDHRQKGGRSIKFSD